jgi:asparagine synthase (glutamine-hydrolysing)
VTATAAGILRDGHRRLAAFTSAPLFSTDPYVGARFGDESAYACATADEAENVDLEIVQAADLTPLQAIPQALEISLEPIHSACNMFWILEINRIAAARGCQTLLAGQCGNGGVSWKGNLASQPFLVPLQRPGSRAASI